MSDVPVKNVSGEDRIVDGLLVLKGGVLRVSRDRVESFTCQPDNWSLVDTTKKKES